MTIAHPRTWLPPVAIALAAPAAASADEPRAVLLAQLTIHERIIIRVPRVGPPLPPGRAAMPAPVTYRESKGPRCIASNAMAGAVIGAADRVDLVLAGGARVRAELDGDCPPLDFYSGFYLKGTADGMVCSGRDAIRVRSGASCPIRRFRALTPRR